MRKTYLLKLLAKTALYISVIMFVIFAFQTSGTGLERTGEFSADNRVDKVAENHVKTVNSKKILIDLTTGKNKDSETSFNSTTPRLQEPDDKELWKLLVKRYWDLTKNLTSPTNGEIQPSNFTDYFINRSEYSLWGSNSYVNSRSKHLDSQSHSSFPDNDRIIPQLVFALEGHKLGSLEKAKTKKILLYDSFQWWKYDGDFSKDCPGWKSKCLFVDGTETKGVDAILLVRDSFHTSDVKVGDSVKRFYFILESPYASDCTLTRENDLLTSYWRGSDLITPYGKWVYYDPDVRKGKQAINYAAGKTKMAAIFVSNCNSGNQRLRYVDELKKYIDVHVFGSCGPHQCSKNDQKACFQLLKTDYKFYLSFENANCKDYITEKLFMNALDNDVVPIVLGGENEDYLAAAPENSYLHVNNFTSAKELGNHLKWLDSNDEEYVKHFEWKGTGEFISSNYFCRICAMLHYSDLVSPPKRKENFVWSSESLCKRHTDYSWKR